MTMEYMTKVDCNARHKLFTGANILIMSALSLIFVAIALSYSMSLAASNRAVDSAERAAAIASDLAVEKNETSKNWEATQQQMLAIRSDIKDNQEQREKIEGRILDELKQSRELLMEVIRNHNGRKP